MSDHDPNTKQVILIPPNPVKPPTPPEATEIGLLLIYLVVAASRLPAIADLLERLLKALEKLANAATRLLEIRIKKPRK